LAACKRTVSSARCSMTHSLCMFLALRRTNHFDRMSHVKTCAGSQL
jgi:hypothetical protein